MKKLSISIPNYNRPDKLKRLLTEVASQITKDHLEGQIQICISDDCSPEDPSGIVYSFQKEYADVDIKYQRKPVNQGMDYNFLDCVLMADAEYCWIIGNDDVPAPSALNDILEFLIKNEDADFIVTPFDVFDGQDQYLYSVYPLSGNSEGAYDCSKAEEREKLFFRILHNSGIFGFLSNVVFKRHFWVNHYDSFADKMNTIFIQMYLNINALFSGANYYYLGRKIIKNYSDEEVGNTVDRMSKILFGLDGVVEYFFKDEIKKHFKRILTDGCINAYIWSLPKEDENKKRLLQIHSDKNDIYKKYFMDEKIIGDYLEGERAVIYGAGDFGRKSLLKLRSHNIPIIGVADQAAAKQGTMFDTFRVMPVDEMLALYRKDEPFIILASHLYLTEMAHLLEKNGVKKIGIVC